MIEGKKISWAPATLEKREAVHSFHGSFTGLDFKALCYRTEEFALQTRGAFIFLN